MQIKPRTKAMPSREAGVLVPRGNLRERGDGRDLFFNYLEMRILLEFGSTDSKQPRQRSCTGRSELAIEM